MRWIGVVVAWACLSGAAMAQPECSGGTGAIVKLTDWSTTLSADGAYSLEIRFANAGSKAVRMVEGTVYFADPLGRSIGRFKLDPDLTLAPSESGSQAWPRVVEATGKPRLATLAPTDVLGKICLEAVVYADGTKERF